MSLFYNIFFFFGLFVTLNANAQESTIIAGHAPDFAGKRISVYGYFDFISEKQLLLDSSTVGQDGEFLLTFDSDEIQYIELTSDLVAAYLYTVPGTSYDIELPLPEKDQPRAFGRKAQTEVIFNNLGLDDINALIIDFNYSYELFFQSNYDVLTKLFSPRNYGALDDSLQVKPVENNSLKDLFERTAVFSAKMDTMYSDWDLPYFQLYRSAVIGDLMMNSPATPREIFEQYIDPYPFQPQHPEFTKLLKRFFKFYFTRYAQSYGEEDLNRALNVDGDYEQLKMLLLKNDFLADKERMDVVIALAITEVWQSKAISQEMVIKVLSSMEANGATNLTKSLASTLSSKLTANKKGFELLDLTFEDQFNDRRHISEFKGKPLLIELWAPWCTSCAVEREHRKALMERYDDSIHLLSIEVSDDGGSDQNEKNSDNVTRTAVHMDSDWMRACQVRSLPHYIILDTKGRVIRDHIPFPSEGLEPILFRIQADMKKEKVRGIGVKEN